MSDVSSRTYDLDWSLPSGGQAGDVTIRPQVTGEPGTLPPLDLGEWSPIEDGGSDLVVRETLGSGGMGTVYLARQRSLDRVVAIKRAPATDPRLASALVREARFLGRLSHPNIVPVYAVGRDTDGAPAVVMKHVEGASWRTLGDVPLDRQLEVLEDVCKAVDYAHSRGVLHRDLKPANVMVGTHGEVYLMDWGIAVETGHTPERIAGTPAYFAPEQLAPGTPLTEATDVFQLGACLYEVLAGRAPFMAPTVAESLDLARKGPAPLPDDVPAELREVCEHAMAHAPAERFPSAGALRERLAWTRRHAASMALSRAAGASLAGLADARDEPERAERLFSEAEFGFRQALATCPENTHAAEGLVTALRTMAGQRTDRGDVRGARALLGALTELSEEATELEAEVDRMEQEQRRTEALARDVDLRAHSERRTRTFGSLIGFFVAFIGAWAFLLAKGVPLVTWESAVLSMVFVVALVWGGLWMGRDWVLSSAANRSLGGSMGFIVLGMLGLRLLSARLGLDLNQVFAVDLLMIGLASSTAALALTPQIVPTGLIFLVGAVLVTLLPQWGVAIYALFLSIGLATTAFAYRRIVEAKT